MRKSENIITMVKLTDKLIALHLWGKGIVFYLNFQYKETLINHVCSSAPFKSSYIFKKSGYQF